MTPKLLRRFIVDYWVGRGGLTNFATPDNVGDTKKYSQICAQVVLSFIDLSKEMAKIPEDQNEGQSCTFPTEFIDDLYKELERLRKNGEGLGDIEGLELYWDLVVDLLGELGARRSSVLGKAGRYTVPLPPAKTRLVDVPQSEEQANFQ